MQALTMTGFGSSELLQLQEMPMPVIGPDDLLVEVAAVGINPVDWKECEGFLQPFYSNYAERWIPGYDAAGRVRKVGNNVRGFVNGDRVVLFSDRRENGHNGTFAQYVKVLAKAVAVIPDEIELVEAAAIPTAGLTAYQALFSENKADLIPGDAVLIHGASGGVGSYAVQFAKSRGLTVAATCSARNVAYVKRLGADTVMDYAQGNIISRLREWRTDGVDAVIDCVSGNTLPQPLDALVPGGRLINIATLTQDGDIESDTAAAAERGFIKIFSIMNFDRISQELKEILMLMETGVVTNAITTFPFAQGAQALQSIKTRGIRGKAVLIMNGAQK